MFTNKSLVIQNGNISNCNAILCESVTAGVLTDGVITIANGDIQNINSFNVTGKVEATELTDNVLTITNGRITNAFEITCNNYVSAPFAIFTALEFNNSSSMSIYEGRLLNVTSIDVNQGDGEVKAIRITDGDITIEN